MEIKGYTYGYSRAMKGHYNSPEGIRSRELLMEVGINWVCLAFNVRQKTYSSTEILFDYRVNVPDLELIATIQHFHEKGVKVCLKPMVDTEDGIWRAQIDFPDTTMLNEDRYWKPWFESYTAYLLHYAQIAEYTGCEMFCVGCELLGTERKEEYWRNTIAAVREVYHGPLTYNTNHGKEEVAKWYDLIDYVGTSAYYPVAKKANASLEEMTKNWEKIAERLEGVSKRLGKKILFMEIGCRSAAGCATMPWDFAHRDLPRSEEEQARFYESVLSVFANKEWFAGFFWWDWNTKIYTDDETAKNDVGFSIHKKQAEQVLKKWYSEV